MRQRAQWIALWGLWLHARANRTCWEVRRRDTPWLRDGGFFSVVFFICSGCSNINVFQRERALHYVKECGVRKY